MELLNRVVSVMLSMFCSFIAALSFYYGIYSTITDGTVKAVLLATALGIMFLYASIWAYKGLE